MIEGKTKSGFEFKLDDEVLNDWELLDYLTEMDNNDYSHLTLVEKCLLDKEQSGKLRDHVRDENGRVKIDSMIYEITDIITTAQELKNS